MSCKIERPAPQELWNRIANDFSTTVLGGGDIIPESNEHYVVALTYAMQEEFYSYAEMQWRERDPRYACCDNLVNIAAQDGLYMLPAKAAQGYIKLSGKPGTHIPQSIKFEINGKKYIPASAVAASIPQGGYAVIYIKALEPGASGNIIPEAGKGSVIDPPDDIDSVIEIYGNMCGGSNAESCEQFRTRYLTRLQYNPVADLKWIKSKILEWPCVTDVCEIGDNCCDSDENRKKFCEDEIYLYVLFRNSFPCGLPPGCVIDDMNAWLFGSPQGQGKGQVPIGIRGAIRYAYPVYINIMIDGLACVASSQQAEIESRIHDYMARLCPNRTLLQRQIEMIIAQIIGDTFEFQVYIEAWTDGDGNETANQMHIDDCGNVQVNCDYKICLHQLQFVNMTSKAGNC